MLGLGEPGHGPGVGGAQALSSTAARANDASVTRSSWPGPRPKRRPTAGAPRPRAPAARRRGATPGWRDRPRPPPTAAPRWPPPKPTSRAGPDRVLAATAGSRPPDGPTPALRSQRSAAARRRRSRRSSSGFAVGIGGRARGTGAQLGLELDWRRGPEVDGEGWHSEPARQDGKHSQPPPTAAQGRAVESRHLSGEADEHGRSHPPQRQTPLGPRHLGSGTGNPTAREGSQN